MQHNMQSYVNYLLEDIQKARKIPASPAPQAGEVQSFENYIANVETWMDSTPELLSKLCGLEIDQFPEPEKLSTEQQSLLIDGLEEMYDTWNLRADIPENVPLAKKYSLITGLLSKEVRIPENGFFVFDFCTGDDIGCELGEYCPCRTFEERNPGLNLN